MHSDGEHIQNLPGAVVLWQMRRVGRLNRYIGCCSSERCCCGITPGECIGAERVAEKYRDLNGCSDGPVGTEAL